MKDFKIQLDDHLWERFYRMFPGHGERSTLLRKIIRNIIAMKETHTSFDQAVAHRVHSDLEENNG